MNDFDYMARAIALAKNGLFSATPNPRVGCVLVKQNHIIAEGWHNRAGFEHAEIHALKNATQSTHDATAYVTLEPCSHFGKTPPCCDALIQAGIKRLVIAMQDPNPIVSSRGIEKCRQAGIEITTGVLEHEATQLNLGFIKRMTQQRPFIRSKIAMSLDGRTALENGESQWITSEFSRVDVHQLRAQSCAILTGINTVLVDNPSLNARVNTTKTLIQPIRVILDTRLQMPLDAKMLTLEGQTWILTCNNNRHKIAELEKRNAQVFVLAEKNNQLDLNSVFHFLAEKQINEVLIEAGAKLNGALLNENWVDEWIIYMATCVLGDKGRGVFSLPLVQTMNDKKQLSIRDIRYFGQDLKLTLV